MWSDLGFWTPGVFGFSDLAVMHAGSGTHHLVLVGRPVTVSVAARCAAALPAKFGDASFRHAGSMLLGDFAFDGIQPANSVPRILQ